MRQIVQHFGEDALYGPIKEAYDSNHYETKFAIGHAIYPREFYLPGKLGKGNMPYASVYFCIDSDDDEKGILHVGGYEEKPFNAIRWRITGDATWGSGPGHDTLGDIKMIQKMEEKKLASLDKHIDPTYNAPASMKGRGVNGLPGGTNFYGPDDMGKGVYPVFQPTLPVIVIRPVLPRCVKIKE